MKIVKYKVKIPAVLFFSIILAVLLLSAYVFSGSYEKHLYISAETGKQKVIPTPIPNHAVNMDALATLTHWQKGVFHSIKVTSESKGVIKNIDKDGGRIQEYDWSAFDYELKITLEAENGNWNDVFLNEIELSKTSFKQLNSDNTIESIDYTDLKETDNIEVFITMDLTKDFKDNFISAEIIRIL